MKTLPLALALVLTSAVSFARSPIAPPDMAARNDTAVRMAIENLAAMGLREERVENVLLAASCGVAGCESSHLVVFRYSSQGVNAQTTSVLAVVTYAFNGQDRVRVVDLRELLNGR